MHTTFAPSLGVDPSTMAVTASGLYMRDDTVGTGATAEPGDSISVNYTGWFPDGTAFDSSLNPGRTPLEFKLGVGRVIPGWDEGVQGMKVGGTRTLIVPPQLAYGSSGIGPIPPNAILVFRVELLAIK
jgi:FKBP-type peptidyl-prolyl cis-trans isomerase